MNDNLALKLRPVCLDEVIGQKHLIGPNKILTNLALNNKIYSMILHGDPGIGKTTIALALVKQLNKRHRVLNAVTHKKQDFIVAIEEAKLHEGMILIIDEIHRMNKDKQDILLPVLENGLITLIGLTSTNPYHSINPAIRSRCQIFKLTPLSSEDVLEGLTRATPILEDINIDKAVLEYISGISNGDLRFAYNLLEVAYFSTSDKVITLDIIKSIRDVPNYSGDKNGDGYYELLSALQKSIRGSDVDAAIYYTARLILMEDLEIIFRRLAVIAYEDIGLANPSMGYKVDSAINLCRLTGLPEARIILGTLVAEMAMSPKSNSAYLAMDSALTDIKLNGTSPIPDHIKPNSKSYIYPHSYPNHYVKQQYLPNQLKNRSYYKPCLNSKYEVNLYKGYKETINK